MNIRNIYKEPPSFSFEVLQTSCFKQLTENGFPPTRVSLVTAPTGYGKTVLLTSLYNFYAEKGLSTYWLSLDENDHSIERVLFRLEMMLVPSVKAFDTSEGVHASDDPIEDRIEALCLELNKSESPVFLFIDNLDKCEDETLNALIDSFVSDVSQKVFIILASTSEPVVRLHRAMLSGLVIRYGFEDLALGQTAIADMLGQQLQDELGLPGIEKIMEVTEGWPAAIRMMQIILRDSESPVDVLSSFSGADIDLANMLNQLIFSRFDQDFRLFLLKLGVLNTFNADLCLFVTKNAKSALYLESLITQNLLIVPLDRKRTEYRLHSLFREFLLDVGRRTLSCEELNSVKVAAAQWCEKNGNFEDGIQYALDAGDFDMAIVMLENAASKFVRDKGDISLFIDWVEKIFSAGHEPGWETDYWYVWGLVFHRRYEFAKRQIERLARRLESDISTPAPEKYEMTRRLEVIRITVLIYTDEWDELQRKGDEWLEHVGADDPFDVATVATSLGVHQADNFDFVASRRYFGIAHSSIAQAESYYGRGWVDVASSLIDVYEGSFQRAYDKSKAIMEDITHACAKNSGMISTVASLAAKAALEIGREGEASEYLAVGMHRVQTHGILDTAALALEASVKLWASPLGDGISIDELRDVASNYPPRLSIMLSCYLIQRLLRLGRVEEAVQEAKRSGIFSEQVMGESCLSYTCFLVSQTNIDLDISLGRASHVEDALSEEVALAKKQGRTGHFVELSLMQMVSCLRGTNPDAAVRYLTAAVSQASKSAYIRPFRDRADAISSVVNDTKAKSWGFVSQEERDFFRRVCEMLPITNSALVDSLDGGQSDAKLLEALTPREQELLTLISGGLTNQQLADRLFVSVATVKWHLYNLYNKLGVSNRSGAIAKARALNIVK